MYDVILRKNSKGELCIYVNKSKFMLPSLFRAKSGKKWSKKEWDSELSL